MSVDYASGLSEYLDKGDCGLPEFVDEPESIEKSVEQLAEWIIESKCTVVHCGAGISTASGIPDFRGSNGVWTVEKYPERQYKKNDTKNISFIDAKPTFTHRALVELIDRKLIHHIISQNVDGLFLKTGIKRSNLSELHGNFFLDECAHCETRFVRSSPSSTMGLKVCPTRPCIRPRRPCRGFLRDTILDWEDDLPWRELHRANKFSQKADLCICLGTSLQIVPAANLPFLCKKRKENTGRVVIVNLQRTKHDKKADLIIHDYIDNLMMMLCKKLNIQVPQYSFSRDLTIDNGRVKVW